MQKAPTVSLIPPRTLAKLNRLQSAEMREYAQELIGGYERGKLALEHRGHEIALDWAASQVAHLDRVIEELRELADL